jgi:hypothetical protein
MDKFPTNGPVPSRDVAAAFNQEMDITLVRIHP